MEKDIEKLIEELTKVRPEMLNEEALKLFNTIMDILNENAEIKKNYINPSKARISYYDTKKGTEVAIEGFVSISKIAERINQLIIEEETGYFDNSRIIKILQELMEDK